MKINTTDYGEGGEGNFNIISDKLEDIFECFDWCRTVLGDDGDYMVHMSPDWLTGREHKMSLCLNSKQQVMLFKLAWLH